MKIELTVNGISRSIDCPPEIRLLDILRDHLGLTGTKEGCGEGECGACSVLLDGRLVNSCLVPASQLSGSEVQTIEGIRDSAGGKILLDSFAEAHSVQCGFCTPGIMMASVSLLRENPHPDEGEIRRALAGNICRCTGYDMIVDGIQMAADRAGSASPAGGAESASAGAAAGTGRAGNNADAGGSESGSAGSRAGAAATTDTRSASDSAGAEGGGTDSRSAHGGNGSSAGAGSDKAEGGAGSTSDGEAGSAAPHGADAAGSEEPAPRSGKRPGSGNGVSIW